MAFLYIPYFFSIYSYFLYSIYLYSVWTIIDFCLTFLPQVFIELIIVNGLVKKHGLKTYYMPGTSNGKINIRVLGAGSMRLVIVVERNEQADKPGLRFTWLPSI